MTQINDLETGASVRGKLNATGLRKNNFAATTAPTAGDDAADGYEVGSCWVNVTADKAYIALDVSAGAAVWMEVQAVLTAAAIKSLYESNGDTNALTDALKAKIDFLTVTQARDLDQMATAINALANGMVYKGSWDASSGSFPSGADTGSFYSVTVAGTVDAVAFAVGDKLVATTDSASTTTYASNWDKLDATDAVLSVAGLIGTITAAALRTALNVEDGATADQSDAEIETAYNNQVSVVSQVEAEAGTGTTVRRWTAQRVAQAIAALAPSGSGGDVDGGDATTKGDEIIIRNDTAANWTSQNPTLAAGEWGYETDTGYLKVGDGTAWNSLGYTIGGQAEPVELMIPCSDMTTDLTTGTAKVTFRMPHAMTVTGVRASVNTAPVGSTIIVDINEGGASILSTKLSIDASEKTSETAATAAVISDSALADDAEITIDIDQVGSSTAGKGLWVTILGTRA